MSQLPANPSKSFMARNPQLYPLRAGDSGAGPVGAERTALEPPDPRKEGCVASAELVTDEIEELHKPILKLCKERGWICFYGNPSRRSGRTLGEPDFVILLPHEKLLLVECKSATGERTKDQNDIAKQTASLGHYVWLVRSMDDFERAVVATMMTPIEFEYL